MPQIAAERKPVVVPHPDRSGAVTYDEFCDLVTEQQKADLIDGVIYMASPEGLDANDLFVWLLRLVADYMDARDLGKVYGSRVALRLDDKNGPEPDIAVVLKGHSDRLKKAHILGPCDVAVEIVSPESVTRDYEKKRALYEAHGVPEYWILDEALERVTLLRLGPTGYTEARPRKGVLASKVLPGFWLRPGWLWEKPRRSKSDALAEILAGPPS